MNPKSRNITWSEGRVDAARRSRLLGQKGCVVWLTGLSGSGKSTIARAAEVRLVERGQAAYVLDGDNVRHGLNRDLGFSAEDRAENIRRAGCVAALMADAGLVVITAFISPYRAARAAARAEAGEGRFVEVYLDVALRECERRDPKGLYKKARAGEIREFTGLDAPYEPPEAPELVLETGRADVATCVRRLVETLEGRGVFAPEDEGATE